MSERQRWQHKRKKVKRARRSDRVIYTGITLMCLCFSVWFVNGFGSRLWLAHASGSWIKTDGRIIESQMSPCKERIGKRTCQPVIKYEYMIEGQRLTNNVIRPGVNPANSFYKGEALALLQQYSTGRLVDVFFAPENPAESCLEANSYRLFDLYGLLVGIAVFVLAFVIGKDVIKGVPLRQKYAKRFKR